MQFIDLPKIDLHCHLDGSVRPETILELANQQGVTLPTQDIEQIRELMIAPETCQNLDEYLKRFDLPLSVMQTAESLERISFELYEDAAKENVKYLEVRFGPLLHLESGLTLEDVLASVVKGMKRAESLYDINGNYILSILRHAPKDRIKEVLDVGHQYLGNGIAAFDLAGGEMAGFCSEFVPYAKYAKEKGYHVTIHAGEQGVGQNVFDAITLLGAQRIGHGIHITGHQDAYDMVKDQQVTLETCPSSNVQTKAVAALAQHPAKVFLKDGIAITINTDNRTVSNTTMTNEVEKVMQEFALTLDDYFAIYSYSVEAAFTSEQVKQHLRSFIPA
ncbi:adenosine deaminase [Vibrio pectenicida]|uniref:Adenosine deaminase n=1 Tax=Vibrio pectenicida TaxID=62763 RepID=A0A7Y4A2K9_9VIBR|nr:adenosine deaminase [Vibrio pectenicida]NOH73298.1 adenosine deaminase [Vibrio pectenicida]